MFENTGYYSNNFELNLGDKFYTDGKNTEKIFCNIGINSDYQAPNGFDTRCR